MPCNSEYLDRTDREAELQRAAKLYLFVLYELGRTAPPEIQQAAQDYYGQDDNGNTIDCIPRLCAQLKAIHQSNPYQFEALVYNAKSKQSRDLANWWEEHQEADRKREAEEAAAKKKQWRMSARPTSDDE